MDIGTIERTFRERVCADLNLLQEGVGRFRVSTPFIYDDGDHLAIVLKRITDGRWILTDEGHTFMRLTYGMDQADLQQGTRQKIIDNALAAFSVEDRSGELVIPIQDDDYANALYSFIQAILKISDVTFLARERARSTFLEDFCRFVEGTVPSERISADWHHPTRDPGGNYKVDYRINGGTRPLLVFALPNDTRTRDATISILQFERWGLAFQSMAVFEDQINISRRVLSMFSEVCDRQFPSLSASDRITASLNKALSETP